MSSEFVAPSKNIAPTHWAFPISLPNIREALFAARYMPTSISHDLRFLFGTNNALFAHKLANVLDFVAFITLRIVLPDLNQGFIFEFEVA